MCRFGLLVLCFLVAFKLEIGNQSLAQSSSAAKSQVAPVTEFDCTDVAVDYANNPNLTRDEKLALMDEALFRALSKFDACQEALSATSGSAGSTGTGGTSSGGGSGSLASSDISGGEQSKSNASSTSGGTNASSSPTVDQANSGKTTSDNVEASQQATIQNGKTPEDIPPADNDSVLEALIRQAALNETDPIIKAKLWNEYRKYKGLPTVN